jgi:hypothetical protein
VPAANLAAAPIRTFATQELPSRWPRIQERRPDRSPRTSPARSTARPAPNSSSSRSPDVALTEVERSWAAPARDGLATGRLTGVSVLAQDAGDAVCWQADRPRLWQRIAGRARRRDLATEIAAAMRT